MSRWILRSSASGSWPVAGVRYAVRPVRAHTLGAGPRYREREAGGPITWLRPAVPGTERKLTPFRVGERSAARDHAPEPGDGGHAASAIDPGSPHASALSPAVATIPIASATPVAASTSTPAQRRRRQVPLPRAPTPAPSFCAVWPRSYSGWRSLSYWP